MINELLLNFAEWLGSQDYSQMLLSGYYSYNWVEATHVLALMVSLGMLFIIDLRMLGLILPEMPASALAARLNRPMWIGFTIMIVTGLLLFYAKPVESTQSLWFRFKMILLVAAAANAFFFHRHLKEAEGKWDNERKAPKPLRNGAILSLSLWSLVVFMGRCIPYDWVDCDKTSNRTILWAAGCVYELQALETAESPLEESARLAVASVRESGSEQ
ncbi:MAG: DUF6644 family protein [Pseudohongiellaceae bacterium]